MRFLMIGWVFILFFSCASRQDVNTQQPDFTTRCSASLGITGDPTDVKTKTKPGLVLAGGSTDVDAAMQWLLERSGGGDVVIIRASGSTGYNEFLYKLGKVNSVETLVINSRALAQNDTVIQIVRNAEALFIAGGDQWNYTQYWMGTKINEAINYLINHKKVPVGGTSAGLAILGEYFFDAKNGTITSDSALINPFDEKMSVNKGFIKTKWLKNSITDSHYAQRNRQGRHVAMLANLLARGVQNPVGIGLDEKTALTIDEKGSLQAFGTNMVWFLKPGSAGPEVYQKGIALEWGQLTGKAIEVYKIQAQPAGTKAGNLKNLKLLNFQKEYWSVQNGKLISAGIQ